LPSDKVYQLLAHGRWFSLGTPASSTTKTGRHDIAEILLKVALNTKNQIKSTKSIARYNVLLSFRKFEFPYFKMKINKYDIITCILNNSNSFMYSKLKL
jgi:hypothetical protein